MNTFDTFRKNNKRLRNISRLDELTQVYNSSAVEEIVRSTIGNGGAMFLCNIDDFKSINRKHGHLLGDECLRQTAQILKYISGDDAIIGRVGGDEFLVYRPNMTESDQMSDFVTRIKNRFKSYNETSRTPIRITIGYTLYREDDSYNNMISRTRKDLTAKQNRKKTKSTGSASARTIDWNVDMKQMRKELSGAVETTGGAFCQEYSTFKMIYQYVERTLTRTDVGASLLLISLSETDGHYMQPDRYTELMEDLGMLIHDSLRVGDVYARYSSCQYIALLSGVDEKAEQVVEGRLLDMFNATSAFARAKAELNCQWQLIEPYQSKKTK